MIPEDLKKTEESFLRYRDRISNLSKDFEIGLFIYLLGKVKWVILLSFLTLFFGAFIYMRYTPKMYQTSTTIQINIKEQPDEFLDIYSYQQQTNINSEVELMKSQKIIAAATIAGSMVSGIEFCIEKKCYTQNYLEFST